MTNDAEFLLKAKKQIKRDEKDLIRSEEQLNILEKRLKEDFNCDSLKDAELHLEKIKINWETKEESLSKLTTEIKDLMPS